MRTGDNVGFDIKEVMKRIENKFVGSSENLATFIDVEIENSACECNQTQTKLISIETLYAITALFIVLCFGALAVMKHRHKKNLRKVESSELAVKNSLLSVPMR